MSKKTSQLLYVLQLADNALILGHRLSEWCGHGPVLEQDIAISNIALDQLGQARSIYQYAANIFNELPSTEKSNLFSSTALQQLISAGDKLDEDDMAYLRDGWDFRNLLLLEHPNKDWAYTVTRSFFYDAFNFSVYTALLKTKDETIAAIAEKSLKEVTYHLRWSSEWMIRLGDGTEESRARIQDAVNSLWMYTGEMFLPIDVEKEMVAAGIGTDVSAIKSVWDDRINTVLEEATLTRPADSWMQEGGKSGKHSEHLGYLLAELQFMQRAYPNMEW
jgi:ring-1,2-phenylacetyl-CoA epoxidase subunit PaaC